MQYFIGFVSPGSAETDSGCGGKLDSHLIRICHLCQKYLCQKLLKSDNPSSSYNRKCPGCFFSGHGVVVSYMYINLSYYNPYQVCS